jgi:hypothetical protein
MDVDAAFNKALTIDAKKSIAHQLLYGLKKLAFSACLNEAFLSSSKHLQNL